MNYNFPDNIQRRLLIYYLPYTRSVVSMVQQWNKLTLCAFTSMRSVRDQECTIIGNQNLECYDMSFWIITPCSLARRYQCSKFLRNFNDHVRHYTM